MAIDADIILMLSNETTGSSLIDFYDVYKIHKSMPLQVYNIGYLDQNGIISLERPKRNNFQGFKINVVHVVNSYLMKYYL